MMFSSRTPRDLNNDPEPHITKDGKRVKYPWLAVDGTLDPRPEYDQVQHNEPNPALIEFRQVIAEGRHTVAEEVKWWLHCFEEPTSLVPANGYPWTPTQIIHARRVLTRLARLTEGAPS